MKLKASQIQPGQYYRENDRLYLITTVQKCADGFEIHLNGLPPIWRRSDALVWVETKTDLRQAFGRTGDV